jgi:Caspase domain
MANTSSYGTAEYRVDWRSSSKRHPGIRRRSLLVGGASLAAPSIARAQASSGVALVIGNSKYQWEAQLGNVRRDAPDIAKAFQEKGLRTELLQDVSRDAFQQAVNRFKSAASGANLAAFYYAGHGASWGKDTYLVPVDADLSTPDAVKTLLPVRDVPAAMNSASRRLLVFDNCRNNPADGWRQLASERGAVFHPDRPQSDLQPNTLTLYSTAPGRVALDGPAGQNSPFAAAFIRHLSGGSVDLAAMPSRLRRDLLIATEGQQVIWDSNTYENPFVLSGAVGGGAPRRPGPAIDSSRIVELPNAYAFARHNGLPLPEGLVSCRPSGNSIHGPKVGAFQFIASTPAGKVPYLVIVLSVSDQRSAQLVSAVHNEKGRLWRFLTGQITETSLVFQPNYGRSDFILDWKDANSGRVTQMQMDKNKVDTRPPSTSSFARLDG